MTKSLRAVLFLAPILFVAAISEAQSIIRLPGSESSDSYVVNIDNTPDSSSCAYVVTINTSCFSPPFTGDHISLAFGDADHNQVYAPKLEDPSKGTFGRCSQDRFELNGACLSEVCYLYLYRSGNDGWRPDVVQVCSSKTGCESFSYNSTIPNNLWYGYNNCGGSSGAAASASLSVINKWLPHALQLLFCLRCWKSLFG